MIIFLDIDGVMVPIKSWKSPELLSDGFPDFSKSAIQVLRNLVSGDTTVMLTTSHRNRFNINEWKQIFNNRGININSIKILEGTGIGISRKEELLNWFNLNEPKEDYIIIDDDKSLNDLPIELKENLLLTSSMLGLIDKDSEKLNAILHSELNFV